MPQGRAKGQSSQEKVLLHREVFSSLSHIRHTDEYPKKDILHISDIKVN